MNIKKKPGRPAKATQPETVTVPETETVNKLPDPSESVYYGNGNSIIGFENSMQYTVLNNLMDLHNDNVNVLKDSELFNMILNDGNTTDKDKLKFLFLKFRQMEREKAGF